MSDASPRGWVAKGARRRAVMAIARQEAGKYATSVGWKNAAALVAIVALGLGGWFVAGPESLQPDRALYPVGLDDHSPWAHALDGDVRFVVVATGMHQDEGIRALEDGRIALWLGPDVAYDDAQGRSVAAVTAFAGAVRSHLESDLGHEVDQGAAFPVVVTVGMLDRTAPPSPSTGPSSPASSPTSPAVASPAPVSASPTSSPNLTSASPGPPPTASVPTPSPGLLGQSGPLKDAQVAVRPADVRPPFPMRSLVMTFLYLIPMNFVAQLLGGALLADRIRKRGVILLSAPVPPWTILAGRVLPYALLGLGVLVAASVVSGAAWQGWVAAVPVVVLVLAFSIVLGLLARHERELTFLLSGATTGLSVFLFLPAVFTAIPAIADASPITLIAKSIRHEPIALASFLYATAPLSLAAIALLILGWALYREETLHSQKPLAAKAVQALGTRMGSRRALLMAGLLAVPFAFALELLVLSFVVPLGFEAAIPLVLVGVAFVEEGLKLMPIRAQRVSDPKGRIWTGLWVGLGFFLGEKLALLLALAGFTIAPLQGASPTSLVLGAGTGILLVAPLALHVAAASASGWGVRRGRWAASLGYLGAVALHLVYDVAVVSRAWT